MVDGAVCISSNACVLQDVAILRRNTRLLNQHFLSTMTMSLYENDTVSIVM